MLGVLATALASEFVQFWVPGRTPLWTDVRDDLIGGAAGVVLGLALLAGWRLARTGTMPQPP